MSSPITQAGDAAPHSARPDEITALERLDEVWKQAAWTCTLAVSAMQKGAVTLLEKPFEENALEAALERAFAVTESDWDRAQGAEALPQRWPETPQQDVQTAGHEEYRRRLASLSQRQRTVFNGIVASKMSSTSLTSAACPARPSSSTARA